MLDISPIDINNDRNRILNSVDFNNACSFFLPWFYNVFLEPLALDSNSVINVKLAHPLIYPNYEIGWNETIQSKIKAPINSAEGMTLVMPWFGLIILEGSTEMMLMILKTQHDNQLLMTNISKRLENIERQFNIVPSPIPSFPVVVPSPSLPNEIHVQQQQQFDSNSSDNNIYTLTDKSTTISEFFMPALENDFQLQQFENNLTQQSYRTPVVIEILLWYQNTESIIIGQFIDWRVSIS